MRPLTLNVRASPLLLLIGGAVATVLLLSLLHLAPVLGVPFIDFPRLVGGVFTSRADVAFGIGAALMVFVGMLVLPPLLLVAWGMLPGESPGLGGALLRGAVWGVILWAAAGLLAPVLGYLNRVPGIDSPGLLMRHAGVLGAAGVLAGHVVYGVALTLVAEVSRGVMPTETLGLTGYGREDLLSPDGVSTWRGPDGSIEPTRPLESGEWR